MVALADKLSGYLDPETGEWADKMMSRRVRPVLASEDLSTPGSPPESFTDFSTADSTDYEEETLTACTTPADPSMISPHTLVDVKLSTRPKSNPFRPTAQSSPFISPIDDELALFSMEPEPEPIADEDELHLDAVPAIEVDVTGISVDLEINSVYKPRPLRRRDPTLQGFPPPGQGKRSSKAKKQQPWHTAPKAFLPVPATATATEADPAELKETKAQLHRQSRDKRRQEKRLALAASLADAPGTGTVDSGGAALLAMELEHMHVTVPTIVDSTPDPPNVTEVDEDLASLVLAADKLAEHGPSVDALLVAEASVTSGMESRLIVEALIVRKLSLEEAYLDFSGF